LGHTRSARGHELLCPCPFQSLGGRLRFLRRYSKTGCVCRVISIQSTPNPDAYLRRLAELAIKNPGAVRKHFRPFGGGASAYAHALDVSKSNGFDSWSRNGAALVFVAFWAKSPTILVPPLSVAHGLAKIRRTRASISRTEAGPEQTHSSTPPRPVLLPFAVAPRYS